jgi:hypothetical protein
LSEVKTNTKGGDNKVSKKELKSWHEGIGVDTFVGIEKGKTSFIYATSLSSCEEKKLNEKEILIERYEIIKTKRLEVYNSSLFYLFIFFWFCNFQYF